MKNLILLRHAKSSWDYSVDDIDRPLTINGIERIKKMVNNNISIFSNLDQIYSSSASRASHTALILKRIINFPPHKIIFDEKLYTFSLRELENFISLIPNKYKFVTIVGHNPGITDLINKLSDKKINNLPTSCWVKLSLKIDSWDKLKPGTGLLGLKDKLK